MEERLLNIVNPVWKPLSHIEEGWKVLTEDEKIEVETRVNSLFKEDYISMKTNPIFYIHLFSFLAQVEVLAVQIPLRFMNSFDEKINKQLRNQLVDEVVHGLIFSKMAFILSTPYHSPVPIIESAEKMCDEIRKIKDEKLALISLNLIAEGWIEEVFKELKHWGFSDEIFQSILDDEKRHVSEAEIYTKLGIDSVDKFELIETITIMEENLLEAITYPTVFRAFVEVGTLDLYKRLKSNLFEKHVHQLKELSIKPSEKWLNFSKKKDIEELDLNFVGGTEIEKNHNQEMFMKIWKSPSCPAIRTNFKLPLSCLLNKKNITVSFIYFLSRFLEKTNFKTCLFLSNHHKVMKVNSANISVRVLILKKNKEKEIGTINIKDVEKLNFQEIEIKIMKGLEILKYWKNERDDFMKNYTFSFEDKIKNRENYNFSPYELPLISTPYPFVISNVGSLGFENGSTALTSLNTTDLCLGKIDYYPVWDKVKEKFLPSSYLPVTLSTDHRVLMPFDFDIKEGIKYFENFDWEKVTLRNPSLISSAIKETTEIMKKMSVFNQEISSILSSKNKKRILDKLANVTYV